MDPRTRLAFVDLHRAITVLMMVQGHTLHVLLSPRYHSSTLFRIWLFLRGLTAPTFFLLSGLSFAVATIRRWSKNLRPGLAVGARLLRFLGFLALGYALHFPVRKLAHLAHIDQARWDTFFVVDVLQLVAVVLLLLQVMVLLCRRPWIFGTTAALLGAVVFAATPTMRARSWRDVTFAPLAAYLYTKSGSLFPLFGWSGYMLLGAGLGTLFALKLQRDKPLRATATLGTLGGGALAAAQVLGRVLGEAAEPDAGPGFLLNRLGAVMLALTVFHAAARNMTALPAPLRALSQESLFVYFVHLCALYGSIWTDGMWQWIGPRLDLLPTLGWVAVFLLGSVVVAWTWSALKVRYPRGKHLARLALVLALALPLI
jgi:hypothetical protein